MPFRRTNNSGRLLNSVEMAMEQAVPSFAVWLGARVVPTCLAVALTVSMTERAFAVNCLAYKPDRAQGQWHAEVVAGKICWYGPNWRSFLPRPKSRAESSDVTNRNRATQLVDRSPTQVDISEDSVRVNNDKNDVQIENTHPEKSAGPLTSETLDIEKTKQSSGLREATPAQAAAFKKVFSLKITPPRTKNSSAAGAGPDTNISDFFIAMTVVALAAVGLAALILKVGRREGEFETDPEAEQYEFMPVEAGLAPPLQPNIDDENQFATSSLPEHVEG